MKRADVKTIRLLLILFMLALVASGLTAIPLQWETRLLNEWLGPASLVHKIYSPLAQWIGRVNEGVQDGYGRYPFLAYGTDWLAFGHVAIALAFIGAVRDPLRNLWVVEFGMLACVLVIPWAILFSIVRGIPPLWTLVDIWFGVAGLIPLCWARRLIRALPLTGS